VRHVVRRLSREGGYSLIELLVSMSILSVVITGITTLFVQGSNAEVDMNRRYQAQQQARVAMDKLRRDAHCSSAVIKPNSSTMLILNDPCVTGGSVSWCTLASGSVYKLYRSTTATCDATSIPYADSIVTAGGGVFTYVQQSTLSLAKVSVDMTVNLKPSMAMENYQLKDDMVLRNSTRTCVIGTATLINSPAPCP
jgi:prepilin-type N-terminal cleavage/methylation domain-containing protein